MFKMTVLCVLNLLVIFPLFDWSEGYRYRNKCYKELEDLKIIPTFAKRVKSADLKVQYGDHVVKCGENFDQVDSLQTPTITHDFKDRCEYVTVLGITPDLPVFFFNPYLMYMVHNVPAELFKDGFKGRNQENLLDKGSDVGDYGAEWVIPKFVTGTTGTRNNTVFYFVYCQCHLIRQSKIKKYVTDVDRRHPDVRGYVDEYQLGIPEAATFNYFLSADIKLPETVNLQDA